MNYWIMKSEPSSFSIADLEQAPGRATCWDGVRNFQVRNMLRDQCAVGDRAFFYQSSCAEPGIVGIMEICRAGYPEAAAFDPESGYYDPKGSRERPLWYGVDVRLLQRLPRPIPLSLLKQQPGLEGLWILRRGNRLSVTPVTPEEGALILTLTAK